MDNLPTNYKEGVPRVSNVVSFVFPFDGNAEERYEKWLKDKGITPVEYLEEANTVGTFVHKQLENYILGHNLKQEDLLFSLHKEEIIYGIDKINYIRSLGLDLLPETYIIDDSLRYQGSIDLVAIDNKTNTVYLYDYKTYGIAKKKFNLTNDSKKPYDKLKKVSLQLSLYADSFRQKGYKIGGIFCLWLHTSGCYEYEVELYTPEKITEILDLYRSVNCILPFNGKIMLKKGIIELQSPTGMQYEYINIKVDINEDGRSGEEIVDDIIALKCLAVNKLVGARQQN